MGVVLLVGMQINFGSGVDWHVSTCSVAIKDQLIEAHTWKQLLLYATNHVTSLGNIL